MGLVFLVPLVVALSISAFGIGLYAGVKRTWPVPELKGLVAKLTNQATGKDQFGRLLSYPGKIEIACPSQDQMTAVLLLIGQSNAANYQGQRHRSGDDRVINFSAGHCYRADSPLLGADGELGETWTLLGTKLIQSGLYRTVILIPAAVGGSAIHRWADGGDLNKMMVAVIQAAQMRMPDKLGESGPPSRQTIHQTAPQARLVGPSIPAGNLGTAAPLTSIRWPVIPTPRRVHQRTITSPAQHHGSRYQLTGSPTPPPRMAPNSRSDG